MGNIDQDFLEYMLMKNVLYEDSSNLLKKHYDNCMKMDLNSHKQKTLKKNEKVSKTA